MSEFLKLAYELLSAILYNIISIFINLGTGLWRLLVTSWPQYASIVGSYFSTLSLAGQILSIILIVILIAIPIAIIVLVVRAIILRRKLRAENDDNVTLYKEIGRLNRQILQLMDEKDKILSIKVSSMGAIDPELLHKTLEDMPAEKPREAKGVPVIEGIPIVQGAHIAAAAEVPMLTTNPSAVAAASAAGAVAGVNETKIAEAITAGITNAQRIRSKGDEYAIRFPKLQSVDEKYADFPRPDYNDSITLQEFTEGYRLYAASRMHLYYTPEIVRRFVAGMASSRLLILEGISGTGKTSLPYSFSRYLNYPSTIISVQPSFRDRTELLGYFNEFSKRFNETEFLRALYEADYREDPTLIVLDEMNLARIEYYFAEMLSVLELPNKDEWTLDLVPTAWPGDPEKMRDGKILISPHTWFVGTANNDDSTFTITDKVYDRAMPIELNERADPFECEDTPPVCITCDHLEELFAKAKEEHPISEATMTKMAKINQYLVTRFKLSFGNRIMKQMYDFIPVYVACGGTELDGLDYILARKVFKKFESQNISFVRDEIKGLIAYMEKTFGKTHMQDSYAYLARVQNLY